MAYGVGMTERIRAIVPPGVDFALDVAGIGVLSALVALAGGVERVITDAHVLGAQETGVRFSRGDTGRPTYALALVAEIVETDCFAIHVGRTFPLSEVAHAHRVGEAGAVHGKLVLLVG